MRTTISDHVESFGIPATQIWPNAIITSNFRPMLNVALLAHIISQVVQDSSEDTITSNKKRKIEDSLEAFPSSKRQRNSSQVFSSHFESEHTRIDPSYPAVEVKRNYPDTRPVVPVLRHVLEMQYMEPEVQSGVQGASAHVSERWTVQDETLCKHLLALSESLTAPKKINLGEILLGKYEGRFVGLSPRDNAWLVLLPRLVIDADSNDLSTYASDLLQACRTLQRAGQAYLRAFLHLVVCPQDPESVSFPSFSLHVDIEVALDIDAALRNDMPNRLKQTVATIEDARRRLFRASFMPEAIASTEVNDAITVSSFYSILRPAPFLPSASLESSVQPEGLLPSLLPFQRRSVAWLLEREGMAFTPEGTLIPSPSKEYSFWNEVHAEEHTLYFNRLSGEVDVEAPSTPGICGGMLAEEPGLGKTVETIALILMNPAPPSWNPTLTRSDPLGRADINAVKSTLIVTPPALASQWIEELSVHAPSLKVLVYEGWNKVKIPIIQGQRELDRVKDIFETEVRAKKRRAKKLEKERANQPQGDTSAMVVDNTPPDLTRGADGKFLKWCDYVHQYDVVITTYSILRTEVHAARPGRDMGNRANGLRSPLIAVEWKRVVMDEVQMVGGGSTAEMVSLIPRLSSLAVSGTPARAQVSDLIHVLKFLRIDQIVGDLRLCKRLLKPGFSEDFTSYLQHYGIRTTKSSVASELTIPQQTRYLVGIELGKVERHVYDQALERMLFDLGLDARGVTANSDWKVDSKMLRSALRNLRGICTHPQVGQLQGKNDTVYKPNALKTMDAVLQMMQDQNWKNLVDDWMSKIELLIRQAQLEQMDDTLLNNYQNALKILQLAGKETNKYIEEIKDALTKHGEKSKEMIAEAARLRQERGAAVMHDKGKGKASDISDDSDEESNEESSEDEGEVEEKGLPKTPAGEEHKKKGVLLKDRLRKGYIFLHRVHFLQGDVWHVLGNSAEEDAAYQNAEKVREDLLRHAETEATNSIARLASTASNHNLKQSDLLVDTPLLQKGGIKSSALVKELNNIIDKVLNKQAELLWKWRTHIMGLLTRPLNPLAAQTEADGQEFQRTLDDQGEVEIYFQCYVALLADRREALINERTLLAAHTLREKQSRSTKAAMKAASAAADLILEAPEGLDIEPKHEVIHSDLTVKRKQLLTKLKGRAVKSILVELNAIYMSINDSKHPEKILIKEALDTIRSFTSQQTSLHDKFENDLNLLRKSFNQRIRYFWQLQEISDSVADVEFEEPTVAAAIHVCVTGKADLDAKMNTARARFRYLENLSKNKDSSLLEDEKECVLCRCEFIRGYITHCGHVFCEICMKAWLHKKDGKTCPVCRIAIDAETIQRFVIDTPAEPSDPPPKLQVSGEHVPKSHRIITYNRIEPSVFEEIQTMETYGDFGSKIQTLVRHLAHLKLVDPGSKSIVFSAWADSLNIVEHALRENGISTLRIGAGSRPANSIHKFRTDPSILVLLLHGETENAGLNVTCACRVFLLESVVHHSFEIQAIARIDRLGQTRPTEVYCYYAEDTVERNILDLAARKGLSLYTKENSKGTVSVSPFNQERDAAIDDPAKKTKLQKGDFIYRVDDMLAILFPHMFEDLEFLLPPAAIAVSSPTIVDEDVEMTDVPQLILREPGTNAQAGPSRLSY